MTDCFIIVDVKEENAMEDKRKKIALRVLRENYTIVGDGVAHRNMDKAFESNSTLINSVRRLIKARSHKEACQQN